MEQTETVKRQKGRNLILPNLITILGMLMGMYSLVMVMNGDFKRGAAAIIFAAVFDGLDGKVARLVNGASEFGVQLDSLADLVSFGVAPAVLIYQWQFLAYNQLGVMVMFLYVACGALRLARFNVQTKKVSSIFFVGLPIPAAASILAVSVLFILKFKLIEARYLSHAALALVVVLAFLMVSTVPYFSFKKIPFKVSRFNLIVFIVIILSLIVLEPVISLFAIGALYLVSGFVLIPFKRRIIESVENKEQALEDERISESDPLDGD